jgi:hypothetical protein
VALIKEPRAIEKIQPWIGSVLFTIGLTQAGVMALTMKAATGFSAVLAVLGLCGVGLGLIKRQTSAAPGRFYAFVLGSFVVAGALVSAFWLKR